MMLYGNTEEVTRFLETLYAVAPLVWQVERTIDPYAQHASFLEVRRKDLNYVAFRALHPSGTAREASRYCKSFASEIMWRRHEVWIEGKHHEKPTDVYYLRVDELPALKQFKLQVTYDLQYALAILHGSTDTEIKGRNPQRSPTFLELIGRLGRVLAGDNQNK